ncbi:uracil-DNA glycosylase [symbiont of Argiope bruennichi]|uniref:uracil-DNA glycosylase n=1 Tax=symbiont of Argiope bruennichi TaxID=2810479 RepID=UPI003DA22092
MNNLLKKLENSDWKEFFLLEEKKPYFKTLIKNINIFYEKDTCYPEKKDIFNCFLFTPLSKVKVVILGQDPYFIEGMAHGLAFSVASGKSKSLTNLFKEIYNSFGFTRNNYNLTDWAENGVLLLNTILTVKKNIPLSHKNIGWENFSENLLLWLSKKKDFLVFLLLGNYAKSYQKFITNKNFKVLMFSHPSPFSYEISLKGSRCFWKINNLLNERGLKEIAW